MTEVTNPDLTPRTLHDGPVQSAATEAALGTLHGAVATVLTTCMNSADVSAAMVGAAITFLKNNNITASPTDNAALSELNRALQQRRRRKGMDPAALKEATEHFDAMNGANGMPIQ